MREQHIIGMEGRLRTFSKSNVRSLSGIAIRREAKEGWATARPRTMQTPYQHSLPEKGRCGQAPWREEQP